MRLSLVNETAGYLCDFLFFSSDTVYKCKADGEEFDQTEVVYSDHHKTLISGWLKTIFMKSQTKACLCLHITADI